VHEVALLDDQLSVAAAPLATVLGVAVMVPKRDDHVVGGSVELAAR
jgi:hypothetical protein